MNAYEKSIKGTRQRFNEATGHLINEATGEVSTRSFWTAGQARQFCKLHGALFLGT